MRVKKLKVIVISTPIGFLGSGKGGGVELTIISLIKGLLHLGNEVTLVAPCGSKLPPDCQEVDLIEVEGTDQRSWQKQDYLSQITIPINGVLPKLLKKAIELGKKADAVINMGYDWLPLWLTPYLNEKFFHLISMGGVAKVMKDAVKEVSLFNNSRLAFHTYSQAKDYELSSEPIIVGNGFDLENYNFNEKTGGPLGWAGRIAPEKGLEDAVAVAAELKETLYVWGFIEDHIYAQKVEGSFPKGTISWRGFLATNEFQEQLGECRVLINTPKWNEAFGNVVIESLACGVPVVAYKRGGPGELINNGITGWLAPQDDLKGLMSGVLNVSQIDRSTCRAWVEKRFSYKSFGIRIHNWIHAGINDQNYQEEIKERIQ